MKRIILSLVGLMFPFLMVSTAYAQTSACTKNKETYTEEQQKLLAPYPQELDSLVRKVVFLEPQEDESLFKVEIVVGKNMTVDCNRHSLISEIVEDVVSGWGYSYYRVETEGLVMSTMMACHDAPSLKFVSGQGLLTRYNSRLPLVVYLPKGYELKYRVWRAGELEAMN